MATFDFKNYLSNIDPANEYKVTILSGGRVNLTARAIKTCPCTVGVETFPGRESIVLKYAPPYIAMDGEGATFSQFRQTIEARALGLFTIPDGELIHLCDKWDIKVPQLLYHDSDQHVIIMTDLGEISSLTTKLNCLTPLQGGFPKEQQEFQELGTRLGGFMAELHSPSTLEKLGQKCENYFDNPDISSVIHENMVIPIRRRLLDFNIPDSEVLYACITQDDIRRNELWERNFMHGDLWTGSVLLDSPSIYVIDWEFAGIGRGMNGDMAIILAQLHLHLIEAQDDSSAKAALRTLIQSTAKEYRCQHQRAACACKGAKDLSLQGSRGIDFPVEFVSIIRSAFITHGRKMINNAIERDWRCGCCKGKPKLKLNCMLVRKMVDRGVWYVRTAANDTEEFIKETNWNVVKEEEEKVMIGLFLEV